MCFPILRFILFGFETRYRLGLPNTGILIGPEIVMDFALYLRKVALGGEGEEL